MGEPAILREETLPPPEPNGPPVRRTSVIDWVRENLFSSWLNSALTIVFGTGLALGAWRLARYVFVTARWEIVRQNLTNFMVGFFPRDQLWRPWAAIYLLTLFFGFRWGVTAARRTATAAPAIARLWPLALLGLVLIAFSGSIQTAVLLVGIAATLVGARLTGAHAPRFLARHSAIVLAIGVVAAFEVVAGFGGVGIDRWRGLMLTLFLAAAGILLSFPFGVLLALGRRSSFPAIRLTSVGYIELIRGVPLITLLFMAFLILGFFLPSGFSVPSLVTRVLVALVLFTAAYLAEVVRGGLQAVPKGQIEAAQALGLSPVTITRRIVLPQALRAVIPAIVGQFISLFKDTSLVGFVGLAELLGISQDVTKQPEFLGKGLQAETLTFAAFIYWVGAYWMSRSSQRLERRLGVGER